ncbi:hypothetical protein Sneaky_24 [Paenibacillus phage Sneaky]|nr:hypothetical protein Bohemia_24 [Paenibacillus phage Bohemia]QVV20084.1 hypothetical protein Pahemo_24 [Paenibacillus phage Pahemo]QVV20288.1 hypothetical protein Sneaky_24 [Paenibacillus phage Sneaky]
MRLLRLSIKTLHRSWQKLFATISPKKPVILQPDPRKRDFEENLKDF